MMKCTECGKELDPGAKFCTYCGAPVTQQPEAETAFDGAAEERVEPETVVEEEGADSELEKTVTEGEEPELGTEAEPDGLDVDATTVMAPELVDDDAIAGEPTTVMPGTTTAIPHVEDAVTVDTDDAGQPAAAAVKKVPSRRVAIGAGVAAAAVAVGAIGAFVFPGLSGSTSKGAKKAGASDVDDSNEALDATKTIIKERQVKTDLTGVPQLSSGFVSDGGFVDGGSYRLDSVKILSQNKSGKGVVTVKAQAVTRNNAFESTAKLTGTYTKNKGQGYTPKWKVDSSTTKAIAPIERDPSGRWAKGDVSFDKKSQTSTVTVDYQPAWFETIDGDVKYVYTFDGSKWALDGDQAPKITYGNLVCDTYKTDSEAKDAFIENFKIASADNGKLKFSFRWLQIMEPPFFGSNFQVNVDVNGEADLVPVVLEGGEHRVVATTYIEQPSADDANKTNGIAVSIAAVPPSEYEDENKKQVRVKVTGKLFGMSKRYKGDNFGGWDSRSYFAIFEIPQEQSPTKSE